MSLDGRIQAYLRAVAPEGREVVELGGLTATFNREDPMRYRNYAIPGEAPWDIAGLVEASRERDRLLTPGDDDTRRVYERAGFTATSTMLAYAAEP